MEKNRKTNEFGFSNDDHNYSEFKTNASRQKPSDDLMPHHKKMDQSQGFEELCKDQSRARKPTKNLPETFSQKDKPTYRRPVETQDRIKFVSNKSINLTDLVEESTTEQLSQCHQQFFEPSEITGRSTSCSHSVAIVQQNSSPSVEQILANSFSDDVRSLGYKLESIKLRQSISQTSRRQTCLPRTADISLESRQSIRKSDVQSMSDWAHYKSQIGSQIAHYENEEFLPSDKLESILLKDERSWQDEYANLPASANMSGRDRDITLGPINHSPPEMSISQFFSQRSETLRNMLPNLSPQKHFRPSPLIDDDVSLQSEPYEGKLSRKNKTYELQQSLVPRVSTIAKHLYNDQGSPKTLASNLCNEQAECDELPCSPLADILYITKPILVAKKPVKQGTNEIKILKVEEFYGNRFQPLNVRTSQTTNLLQSLPAASDYENKENCSSDTLSFTESLFDELKAIGEPDLNIDLNSSHTQCQSKNNPKRLRSRDGDDFQSPEPQVEDIICNRSRSAKKSPKKFGDIPSRTKYQLIQKTLSETTEIICTKQESNNRKSSHKSPFKSPHESPFQSPHESPFKSPHKSPFKSHKSPMLKYNSPTTSVMSSPKFCSSKTDRMSDCHDKKSGHFYTGGVLSKDNTATRKSPSVSPTLMMQTNSQCSSTNDLRCKDLFYNLKSSHGELSWPSIKLRKCVKKSFTIKNTASNRLSLKMEIVGPGFQICGAEQSCLLTLQTHECRTITVAFCPTVIGPAIGSVCFSPAKDTMNKMVQKVYLYGYGGHAVLRLHGIERGPIGSAYLKLGNTDELGNFFLQENFRIYNKGPLMGVAVITDKFKEPNFFINDSITIQPMKCIIAPDSYQEITVTYVPTKSDVKKMLKANCAVHTITTLSVTFCDDPYRQRIEWFLQKLGGQNEHLNLLKDVVTEFPFENREDFSGFHENEANLSDIFSYFEREEIALTINRVSLDDTNKSDHNYLATDMDNTIFFRTLQPIPSEPHQPILSEQHCATSQSSNLNLAHHDYQRSTADNTRNLDCIMVHPQRLHLNPFTANNSQMIQIKNGFNTSQTFELVSNFRHILNCMPISGIIEAGQSIDIYVKIKKTVIPSEPLILSIYTENDKIHIPIYVDKSNLPEHLQ